MRSNSLGDGEHPQNPARPDWKPSTLLANIELVGSLCLGVLFTILVQTVNGPPWFRWASWAVVVVAALVLIRWFLPRFKAETKLLYHRISYYEDVFNSLRQARDLVETQREQIQKLHFFLMLNHLDPESLVMVTYRLQDAILKGGQVSVTLNDNEEPTLAAGTVLTIVDSEDGMQLGTIEVTHERTVSNRCIAKFIDWNGLFLTGVMRSAAEHTPLETRAIAVLISRIDMKGTGLEHVH